MGVNEKDWKLFRRLVPEWQEAYMEKLCREYVEILTSDENASERFWRMEKRLRTDRRSPGVIITDMRRSTMFQHLMHLYFEQIITEKDLDGFSDELKQAVLRPVAFFSKQ